MAQMIKQAGFAEQPNAFVSAAIELEVKTAEPTQPAINTPKGESATWKALYDAAVGGAYIATPYHDVKVTDPDKLAHMTDAYRAFLSGGTLSEDIRDVFLDTSLADMGFAPKPDMTGRQLLAQQCQQCHHSNLDQTITREAFLVDKLDEMSREEKDKAIERINTPLETRLTMPPPLFRTLSQRDRNAMIAELKK